MHLYFVLAIIGLVMLAISGFVLYNGMIGLSMTVTEITIYAGGFIIGLILSVKFGGKLIRNYGWRG